MTLHPSERATHTLLGDIIQTQMMRRTLNLRNPVRTPPALRYSTRAARAVDAAMPSNARSFNAMPSDAMPSDSNNPRSVVLRDLLLFQMKLWLDGLKDVVLSPLSIVACILDVLFRRTDSSSLFYGVMRLGERFDLWLNLYGPAKRADASPDGLLDRESLRSRTLLDQIDRESPHLSLRLPHSQKTRRPDTAKRPGENSPLDGPPYQTRVHSAPTPARAIRREEH